MSFGGLFGGGSSSGSSSSSSSSPSTPFPAPTSSSATLQRIQNAVSQQAAVANARYLISKVNENCFAHCIATPGSSLSSGEHKCLTACMEKYFDAWNVVNRTRVP
ncbi:protein translocase subunit [Elasticomyces elasticus]|uniref:Mitochondrial import inner membrane translocase subunit n=1 Tax=Exophiala sideris TaxID=1016849 RepID=A0ABR0JAD2_9EURO|nr:protein translocase subunit [Elasticomyces elasticus]KAK5030325.1 protein translocase subunit [Exophiala sideris]KAK5038378.1 protein translocase subunit [Exophiala sideris]KAK5060261.1 protein translocase subunit [Exophiala sideris]KAK5183172.1 protein translocase subunit [Eurotiomycetes sp. CCFEE 6388]